MAAFSSIFDSSSSSSSLQNPSPILDETNNALSSSSHNLDQHVNNIMMISSPLPNYNNVVNYYNMDSSSVVTHDYHNSKFTPNNPIPMSKKRKSSKQGSSPNCAQSKDVREVKAEKKQKKGKLDCDEEKKEALGYIHVRARRGQATDSHSLAERVRRERISERMKQLQALVPGCDKVTGKALMLDEIINYVQSLQNQVEFLSMKIASVNPMFYDFGMDLDSFMVGPQQNLSIEECNATMANPYPDLLLQQDQIPNVAHQVHNRQVLWEVEDQRQRIINQPEISNNLFLFH